MCIIYIYVALALYNIEYLTLPMSSIENIVDEAANVAVVDGKGRIRRKGGSGKVRLAGGVGEGLGEGGLDWRGLWSEGTDAVMDVPVGGVCEILYGRGVEGEGG